MTPATQPANGDLPRNVGTGNVLTVEPNRPRRVRMGEVGDWKLDLLIRDFARFINSEVALLCQGGGRGQPPAVVSSWGLGAIHEEVARPHEGGLVGRAPPLARAALEPLHPLLDPSLVYATHPPLRYAAAAPVRLPTALAGRLIAGFVTPPQDRPLTLWTAESYAALIALYLTNPKALDELLPRRDGLTGCLTSDGTRHELDREINRSARDGLRLSVCVIDLDDFKRVDDDLGRKRRNAMLALAAGILRTSVRSCDTVGRYGRDRLIAILPQTSRPQARQVAERLRARLADPPNASLGVAQWTPGTPTEELLATADRALLAAKRSARLVSALEPGATAPSPHRAGGQSPPRIQTMDRKN